VSVFSDNSGAVSFDEKYLITHKVETHNTPSALDPFGGAITGIVGVNRDTIGFGLGAKPVANFYGFCFADPRIDEALYKGPNFTQKMLSSRRILDGVVEGVNAGGNQSGIPTPSGFIYFDERYRGKPLVFVGTIGLIPKKIKSKFSHLKKATPGDYIVMIGGRVGKDGIHGATFSSEALGSGSPVTAVQIGDPITQKKLSDALIMEARDLLLYNSITDNGAGGLSCSVAEMAKESGGCWVELEKVPLKYPGLSPWEIWISESQERMTLAIPPKKWKKFYTLMKKRGVEATVIGKFTNSGKCIVVYNGKVVMDIDMQFLHYGLPKRPMKTMYPHHSGLSRIDSGVASLPRMTVKDLTKLFLSMLGRLNIASFEFISQQYDYMVLGNSVLGPLQGKGRINADTAAIRPLLDSKKCLIISCGLYPSYSDIDTYIMAAASLDTAIRNVVAAGGDLDKIYLLDNFCWYDSYNPIRLRELKRAAQACYDYATLYQTPFISGKDSMFNDFAGFDKNGKAIKISIPPTLLITSVGIIDDFMKVVSLDAKIPGDLVYILGETYDELGGSEYCSSGGAVPRVDAAKNKKLYKAFSHAIRKNLISSSISCGRGGLAIALAKKALGGKLGIEISLKNIPGEVSRDDFALFSESQGRIVVTVHPERKKQFEKIMRGNSFAKIGKVLQNKLIIIKGLKSNVIVNTNIDKALKSYRKTFEGY
ncbi:phosphoribosylformylglycinamidine synthase, partial [Candidatus Gottesmanbacteria bacterium]|nr:phosphoribosylformylglycinamidine synthase [Candidatus Gottesmanbacteria bacterium]